MRPEGCLIHCGEAAPLCARPGRTPSTAKGRPLPAPVAGVAGTPLLSCCGVPRSSVSKAAGPQSGCQGLGVRGSQWSQPGLGGGESGHRSLPCTGVLAPLLRVHELEEMVKDQETTAEQALEEEVRRHREAYSKLERERSTEIELLNTRWARGMAQCPLPSAL